MAGVVDKYAEAEGVVETVIKIFSERCDPSTARECGRDIADLKRRVTERHQEFVKSIRGTQQASARAGTACFAFQAMCPRGWSRNSPRSRISGLPCASPELSGQADRARRQLDHRRQASDGTSAKEDMLSTKAQLDQSIGRMRQENVSLQQHIGAPRGRLHLRQASPARTRRQGRRWLMACEVPTSPALCPSQLHRQG